MGLAPGTRIGPYEVVSIVGVGGMGEVYRARDPKLQRDVALKILPEIFASDPDRSTRFEREARTLAALNHAHIAGIYGFEESNGVRALALEFVDGETLADRIVRGPIPIDETLSIARQIAEALEAAHEQGIIHRDLKPANIKVREDGTVKVLDFGLAKAMDPDPSSSAAAALADSPTITNAAAMTAAGIILGTAAYMSPEQARGLPVDKRTDIWAFGCVLYETLTGHRPFVGKTPTDVLAAVVKNDPDWTVLPRETPQRIRLLLARCLQKDKSLRLRDIGDARLELGPIDEIALGLAPATGVPGRGQAMVRNIILSVAAGLVFLAIAAGAWWYRHAVSAPQPTTKRFMVRLPDLLWSVPGDGSIFELLPDGSGLVYIAISSTGRRIHLYTLTDGVSRIIPGTEEASDLAVSPDGKWLAFSRDQRLMKVAIAGGSPVPVCPVSFLRGISWGDDDWIVYAQATGLQRVSSAGGDPETLTSVAAGEVRHVSPHVLPGGKTVLFTILAQSGSMDDAATAVVAMATGKRQTLMKAAADARYSPSGHLLFVRDSNLMGISFDADRLRVSGAPFLAASAVRVKPQTLKGFFDLARDGTLVYLPAGVSNLQGTLVWIDLKGVETPLPIPVRAYFHPALLPDERSVIVEIEETPHNLWHLDLTTGALTRLTHEGANHRPVASPDGRFFAFSSDRTTPRSIFRQATDGSSQAEQLSSGTVDQNVTSWSRDGGWLALAQTSPQAKEEILVLPLNGRGTARPFQPSPYNESAATFSPDGRWIAYTSDESGRQEIMIAAFPGPGPRKPVSTTGGESAVFSADGKTIFYRLKDQIWAAALRTDPALVIGRPSVAFRLPATPGYAGLPNWLISRKGDRVLAVKYLGEDASPRDVHVIVNWFESLRGVATGSNH
jgi:eukaryotic-like serine/threonine-protein kinase